MNTDNPPAVDPEALARVHYEASWPSLPWSKRREYEERRSYEYADAILSSGILRDADEVRREGFLTERAGARTQYVRLQAAIAALCEEAGASFGLNGSVFVNDLRALVADGGEDALRERDADKFEEGARKTAEIAKAYDADLILPVNPYRDTAGEPHTHGGTDAPECTTCRGRDTAGEAGDE